MAFILKYTLHGRNILPQDSNTCLEHMAAHRSSVVCP